jgi:dihydrolipoamide dehydrogenase
VGTFIELGLTIDEIKQIVFPHPTVSEIIREAVFQY